MHRTNISLHITTYTRVQIYINIKKREKNNHKNWKMEIFLFIPNIIIVKKIKVKTVKKKMHGTFTVHIYTIQSNRVYTCFPELTFATKIKKERKKKTEYKNKLWCYQTWTFHSVYVRAITFRFFYFQFTYLFLLSLYRFVAFLVILFFLRQKNENSEQKSILFGVKLWIFV